MCVGERENNVNLKNNFWVFPGGPVVNTLSANAGDTGSIPGLGRSYMLQSSWVLTPQLINLHSRAHDPQLSPCALKPLFGNKRSHPNEKPVHCNEEYRPLATTKTRCSQKLITFLKSNFTEVQFTPWNSPILSVQYSLLFLRKISELCSHHHNLIIEHFHHPKKKPCAHWHSF